MKKYWIIAGAVLLVVGFFVALFPYVETFKQDSIEATIEAGGHYYVEPFSAGSQDWLDLDILASENVDVVVKGQIYRTIFNLRGRLFQYRVYFDNYDAYRVEIYNPSYADVTVEISGSIHVRRTPEYLYSFKLMDLVQINGIGIPIVLFGLGITVIGLLKKPSVEAK